MRKYASDTRAPGRARRRLVLMLDTHAAPGAYSLSFREKQTRRTFPGRISWVLRAAGSAGSDRLSRDAKEVLPRTPVDGLGHSAGAETGAPFTFNRRWGLSCVWAFV